MRFFRLLILLPLLAACGDLPEPFLGNPGATARRLAMPVSPMLAVPPPENALLSGLASQDYANLLALNLQKEEIAALVRAPREHDWRLGITGTRQGDKIVARYAVIDPAGKEQGAIDGAPFPAAGWIAGWPATLAQAVDDGVPKILALMTSIRATRDRADPTALVNRIPKLFVPAVTGAPGDGNPALTRLLRAELKQIGPLVQVTPDNADFTIRGVVTTGPLPRGQQRIEIVWTVTRPSGVVVGKVSQINAIPAGSLSQYWGEVAIVVTKEAAGGLQRVVERFIGRDPDHPGPASAPSDLASGPTLSGSAPLRPAPGPAPKAK